MTKLQLISDPNPNSTVFHSVLQIPATSKLAIIPHPVCVCFLIWQDEAGQQKKLKKEDQKKKKTTRNTETKTSQAEDQDSGVEVYFREKDRTKEKTRKTVSLKLTSRSFHMIWILVFLHYVGSI